MTLLTKISALSQEIQNRIFYYIQNPLATIFSHYKKQIINNNYILVNTILDYDQWMVERRYSTEHRPHRHFTHYRDRTYNEFKSSIMQDRYRRKGHNKSISRKCKRLFVKPRCITTG